MLSESDRNKKFPFVSNAPPPIRPPQNCGYYNPFTQGRKLLYSDGLGLPGRIEKAAMETYPGLPVKDAVLLYTEGQRRTTQETVIAEEKKIDDKIWKPGKGWRRYGSLRELADVLGMTAPNIAYHVKQNNKLYTQNIHHYEKGWFLLSANQNKIKESLKKQ